MALVARRARPELRARYRWALEHKLAVELDRKLVPLAVAEPDLLAELEDRFRTLGSAPLALASA